MTARWLLTLAAAAAAAGMGAGIKKRSTAARYDVLLLDIEGTTTPISFVKDVLFPYALSHLKEHLSRHFHEEQTRDDIRALIRLSRHDQQEGLAVAVIPEDPIFLDPGRENSLGSSTASAAYRTQLEAIISNVQAQMAADRKTSALKQLQGHIWASGYASGELQGTVYSDASEQMKRWHAAGLRVCIYSSGSVEAQRLIFAHTDRGSLADCITAYFDTAVGPKQDSASYTSIARQLAVEPSRLLFLTDVEGEARACEQAGCHAKIVVREGNKPVDPACGIPLVHSFDEVDVGL